MGPYSGSQSARHTPPPLQAVFIAAIYTDIATVTNKRVAVFIPVVHLIGGQVGCCIDMPNGMGSIRGRRSCTRLYTSYAYVESFRVNKSAQARVKRASNLKKRLSRR